VFSRLNVSDSEAGTLFVLLESSGGTSATSSSARSGEGGGVGYVS
jgi:hypothetical protein